MKKHLNKNVICLISSNFKPTFKQRNTLLQKIENLKENKK
jgi:hypothetical protein